MYIVVIQNFCIILRWNGLKFCCLCFVLLSCVLPKLQKATIGFIMFVRPPFRLEHLGSHYTDFYEIWLSDIILKSVEKIVF
jgi:hypothetical protein